MSNKVEFSSTQEQQAYNSRATMHNQQVGREFAFSLIIFLLVAGGVLLASNAIEKLKYLYGIDKQRRKANQGF